MAFFFVPVCLGLILFWSAWESEKKEPGASSSNMGVTSESVSLVLKKASKSKVAYVAIAAALVFGVLWARSYYAAPKGSIDSLREAELTVRGTWTWGEYRDGRNYTKNQITFWPDGTCALSHDTRISGVTIPTWEGSRMAPQGRGTWSIKKDKYVDTHEEYYRTIVIGIPIIENGVIEIRSASRLRVTLFNGGWDLKQRAETTAYKKSSL